MEFHQMKSAARRALAPVATALWLAASAVGTCADNPAAAIAAAAGHPAQRHMHAEVTTTIDGTTERSTLDVAGTSRLERRCQADLCRGTWFDGSRTFVFGVNGAPLPERDADDDAERTFAAIVSTSFAEAAFLTGGGRVTSLADERGRAELRYRVSAPEGAELIAVADARTHRLQAVENTDGSVYAVLVASGIEPNIVYAPRGYERIEAIDEPLTAPAGLTVRGSESRDLVLLPGPLPIVPCRLAGRAAACLIDSGTTPSAMTLDFAERIGREPHGAIEISALSAYLTGVVDAEPLELGALALEGLHFAVIPQRVGAKFDVIVGSDVLSRLQVELEPARGHARVARSEASDGGTFPALQFSAGLPYIGVALAAGRPPESVLVDTGDTGTISIGYDEFLAPPRLFTPSGHSVATGMSAAAMDTVDGELARIEVGPEPFEHVAVSAVRGQHRAHLGYGFANRCARFVLDLGHSRIACLAREDRTRS